MGWMPRTHPIFVGIVEGFLFGSLGEREELAAQIDVLKTYTQE